MKQDNNQVSNNIYYSLQERHDAIKLALRKQYKKILKLKATKTTKNNYMTTQRNTITASNPSHYHSRMQPIQRINRKHQKI